MLRLERAQDPLRKGHDEEESLSPAEGDQILPNNAIGLGRGWFTSLQAGL